METGYAVESDARMMAVPNKKQKIGFIKRWMLKAVKEAVEGERVSAPKQFDSDIKISAINQLGVGRQATSIDQPERALHFTVYSANGGRIVETRRHDRKTDRSTTGLYIITSDQDFGREIDKIITMEALR